MPSREMYSSSQVKKRWTEAGLHRTACRKIRGHNVEGKFHGKETRSHRLVRSTALGQSAEKTTAARISQPKRVLVTGKTPTDHSLPCESAWRTRSTWSKKHAPLGKYGHSAGFDILITSMTIPARMVPSGFSSNENTLGAVIFGAAVCLSADFLNAGDLTSPVCDRVSFSRETFLDVLASDLYGMPFDVSGSVQRFCHLTSTVKFSRLA